MPDTRWHDTIAAQIRGGRTDKEYGQELLGYLRFFSEDELKALANKGSAKNRWFYTTDLEINTNFNDLLRRKLTQNHVANQRAVNEFAKKHDGEMPEYIAENPVLRVVFNPTYTRGGHKYVNGVRMY